MRSRILTSLSFILILITQLSLQAQLPYTFDAGLYGCPDGASNYIIDASTAIGGTDYDSLYQSYCTSSSPSFNYTLTNSDFVAGNSYDIVLHFAEIFHGPGNANPTGGSGDRVFSVELEGIRVLDSLDIYAAVGANTALVYRKMIQLDADADLDLTFISHTGTPILSAVEILPIGSAITFPPYVNLFDAPGDFLPVVWGAFEANASADARVNLRWTTPEISASQYFAIEMDMGKGVFSPVGQIEAADSQTDYRFRTDVLPTGTYQFRVRFVGIDGHEQISEVKQVVIKPSFQTSFTVFPNPSSVGSELTIRSTEIGAIEVRILDVRGTLVRDLQSISGANVAEGNLSLTGLPAGIYVLDIRQHNSRRFQKLSIQ